MRGLFGGARPCSCLQVRPPRWPARNLLQAAAAAVCPP